MPKTQRPEGLTGWEMAMQLLFLYAIHWPQYNQTLTVLQILNSWSLYHRTVLLALSGIGSTHNYMNTTSSFPHHKHFLLLFT